MRISKTGTQTIKAEMKKKHLTDQQISDLMGITGTGARNQVNGMINGKREIMPDRLEALCAILDLDGGSLLEPDKNKNEELHAEYAALQSYLKTIGVEITPGYYWKCAQKTAIDNFDFMRKYLAPDEKRRLLAIKEKEGRKRVKRETIGLTSDPLTDPEYCQKFHLGENFEEILTLPPLAELSGVLYSIPAKVGGTFYLGYEIRENGKKKGILDHSQILAMLRNVRSSAKALVLAAL